MEFRRIEFLAKRRSSAGHTKSLYIKVVDRTKNGQISIIATRCAERKQDRNYDQIKGAMTGSGDDSLIYYCGLYLVLSPVCFDAQNLPIQGSSLP